MRALILLLLLVLLLLPLPLILLVLPLLPPCPPGRRNIRGDQEEAERVRAEIEAARAQLEGLCGEAVVFQGTRDSATGAPLELPSGAVGTGAAPCGAESLVCGRGWVWAAVLIADSISFLVIPRCLLLQSTSCAATASTCAPWATATPPARSARASSARRRSCGAATGPAQWTRWALGRVGGAN